MGGIGTGSILLGILVLSFVLVGYLGARFYRVNWKKRRHYRKQQTAKRVIAKLGQIEGAGQKFSYLRQIDPLVFEELILEAFERKGVKVARSASYSGDGGIDGRFCLNNKPYLVQCKRYKGHINRKHVLEFAGLLERYSMHGVFCHTGRTGQFSLDFYKQHPYLTIISGQTLLKLLAV